MRPDAGKGTRTMAFIGLDGSGQRSLTSERLLRRALSELMALGFPVRVAWGLIEVGGVLVELGDAERAARLLGAAESILEATGTNFDELIDEVGPRLTAALGEAALTELRAEGRTLTIDDAVALAGAS